MLPSLWRLLSWLFPRAVCQGPAEAKENEAKESPVPSSGEQGPKVLGKSPKEADPSERRPTILLVVGPAEHFQQVMWLSNPSQVNCSLSRICLNVLVMPLYKGCEEEEGHLASGLVGA